MLEDFRQDEGLLDRLLMQVYSQPMYEQIDSVYHFANYMYLVGLNIDKLDSILTYCLDHGICSVAMRTNFVTKENVRKVHDAGLYAFCYTVSDDAVYANYLFQLGVDMICTDFVTEKHWKQRRKHLADIRLWCGTTATIRKQSVITRRLPMEMRMRERLPG